MQGRLHPGVHVALARGRMDEAQVARAMADGELTSPQQYGNSWLFNLRITGTGGAYREGIKEYVWRDPRLYLNEDFLERCAGLPVILEHPAGEMLDSAEYQKRVVGAITRPYIRGDEVWGIARIIDQPTAAYMREHQLSTSPAVVFRRAGMGEKIKVGDGKHLLVEGKPSLVDHLAICEEGVWDKGGPPAGVDVTGEKESTMPETMREKEEETMADRARRDRRDARDDDDRRDDDRARDDAGHRDDDRRDDRARDDAEGEKIDRLLEGIKVLSDRMDALDRARKDEDPETEARQAAELHELAEEEEASAAEELEEEAEGAADRRDGRRDRRDGRARDDDDKRDDDKRDDDDRRADGTLHIEHRDDDEAGMPWEEAERAEGESDSRYSRRVDSIAKKYDASMRKRDDESVAAHCDRVAAASRRDRARRDAQRRLSRVDAVADAVAKLARRVDSLTRRVQDRPVADQVAFADAQAAADAVYVALGDSAPRPMSGESLVGYRVRLARGVQKYSPAWKDSDLRLLATADPASFDRVEKLVLADAARAARDPTTFGGDRLREIKVKRPGGAEMSEFYGSSPLLWMTSFMAPARACTSLRRNPGRQ